MHTQTSASLTHRPWGWIALATVALTACGGNGNNLDDNGRPEMPTTPTPTPTPPTPPAPSAYKTIQDTIFTPICTACHAGASAPRGLRLEEGVSYAALVNAPSSEVPSLLRVKPGDPDNSYLVHKIEGRAAVGARMPLGGPPLAQTDIDLIKQWILDGAQPASVDAPGMLTYMKAVLPAEEAELTVAPQTIVVTASAELDTTLLTAANVTLLRSGGDDSFAEGNEVVVPHLGFTIRTLEPTVLAITVPSGEWMPERYLLTINGTGPSPVTDRSAVTIDGDANGTPGGDFEFSFLLKAVEAQR